MSLLELIGLVAATVAGFGWLNHRFFRLPDTTGITAVGLVISLLLALSGHFYPQTTLWATAFVNHIDFSEVVLQGLLPALLFAGSLHVDISELSRYRGPVLVLSTVGVLISTMVVGWGVFVVLGVLGLNISLWYCLAFGALISPTDPIAVLGVLKTSGVPRSLEMKITGEALFNDGMAVVLFLTLLGIATGAAQPTASAVGILLAKEVLGGIALGLAVGFGAIAMLKGIDSYPVEILITVAVATGGYALAQRLHVSAPLAVVVMGLAIGNHGVAHAMSERTREHLLSLWGLADEILNLMLFGLIAIMLLSLDMRDVSWVAAAAFLPIVLFARLASVALPVLGLSRWLQPSPGTIAVLTWGGLRGGISVALALALPQFAGKGLFVTGTYGVVLFSLLVQGPTLPRLLRRLALCPKTARP